MRVPQKTPSPGPGERVLGGVLSGPVVRTCEIEWSDYSEIMLKPTPRSGEEVKHDS